MHDPFAAHADSVGAANLANPTRFEDRQVGREIIDEVMSVDSIEELDRRTFTYPDGAAATFQGIAENARNALEQEEQRFIDETNRMWERLRDHHGYVNPAQLTDDDVWSWLRAMMTALRNSYQADGIQDEDLFIRVCDSIYPYYGYLLCRLRTYTLDNGQLAMQPNDTEDGYICMHMRLFSDHVLVVGDGSTRRALKQSIDMWNERVPCVPARCDVIEIGQYRDLARRVRTQEAAFHNWQRRGCPEGDDLHDWFEAERTLNQ